VVVEAQFQTQITVPDGSLAYIMDGALWSVDANSRCSVMSSVVTSGTATSTTAIGVAAGYTQEPQLSTASYTEQNGAQNKVPMIVGPGHMDMEVVRTNLLVEYPKVYPVSHANCLCMTTNHQNYADNTDVTDEAMGPSQMALGTFRADGAARRLLELNSAGAELANLIPEVGRFHHLSLGQFVDNAGVQDYTGAYHIPHSQLFVDTAIEAFPGFVVNNDTGATVTCLITGTRLFSVQVNAAYGASGQPLVKERMAQVERASVMSTAGGSGNSPPAARSAAVNSSAGHMVKATGVSVARLQQEHLAKAVYAHVNNPNKSSVLQKASQVGKAVGNALSIYGKIASDRGKQHTSSRGADGRLAITDSGTSGVLNSVLEFGSKYGADIMGGAEMFAAFM